MFVFRSCMNRDRLDPFTPAADGSWLTSKPLNPLHIGQLVNNQSKSKKKWKWNWIKNDTILEFPSNVAYRELDFTPIHRRFIPHLWSSPSEERTTTTRTVVLVATSEIHENEELFSDYFTLVSWKNVFFCNYDSYL